MVSREWGRKGVVIFSDGDDRHSLTPREIAMARVQASDAMLYTVGFGGGATVPALRGSLETYARSTGGRPFFPKTREGARRRLRRHRRGARESVRPLVLVEQSQVEQHVAEHQGPGAQRQVRHQGAAGLLRKRTATRGEVNDAGTGRHHDGGNGGAVGFGRALALGETAPPRAGADVSERRRSSSPSTSASSTGRGSRCAGSRPATSR